nr:hypothetical protein [Bacillota bacterium]
MEPVNDVPPFVCLGVDGFTAVRADRRRQALHGGCGPGPGRRAPSRAILHEGVTNRGTRSKLAGPRGGCAAGQARARTRLSVDVHRPGHVHAGRRLGELGRAVVDRRRNAVGDRFGLAGPAGHAAHHFLGPVAGVVVDRYSRRTLMMIADVVRAIGWGVVAWSMIRGEMTLAVLLAVAAVSATCRTFHRPALQASIAQLVPEQALNRANSLFQMAEAGANLIAPAVGGALVAWLGAGAAVAVSALTCAVAAATLLLVALPPLAPKPVPRRGAISSANWATGWPTSGRDSACCSSCCARLRWSTSPWRPSGRCCRSWRNTAWAPTPAALAC